MDLDHSSAVAESTVRRLPDLRAGVYQHYKGPLYLVLGYGHDATIPDREVVVYVPLYSDPTKTGPRLAVRDVADFFATVGPDTPRFRYLGPT